MSDVTEIRCAVSSGDFPDGASSLVSSRASESLDGFCASPLAFLGSPGTSGAGECALPSWPAEGEESRLLISDRDRDRSECESGRGVISDASSKLSYGSTFFVSQPVPFPLSLQ